MANTPDGRRWTAKYRRGLTLEAVRADSDIRRSWRRLNPYDLPGTEGAWLDQMTNLVTVRHSLATASAADYVAAYRLAELGTSSGPIILDQLDTPTVRAVLDAMGPGRIRAKTAAGMDPAVAWATSRTTMVGATHKLIMSGGRGTVRESAKADRRASGYRRVSDGDPCAFCAMLVSRGPAYTTEARALSKIDTSDPYHADCGCTVEIIYGDWQATELEQQWTDQYYDARAAVEAAGDKPTPHNILAKMREQGTFRDSPASRTVSASGTRLPFKREFGPRTITPNSPIPTGWAGGGTPSTPSSHRAPAGDGPKPPPFALTARDERHIVVGNHPDDPNPSGGGHLAGTGRERKTEFPPGWDRYRIMEAIRETVADPQAWEWSGDSVTRYRETDRVMVLVSSFPNPETGEHQLRAAYPTSGDGVFQNLAGGGRRPVPLRRFTQLPE